MADISNVNVHEIKDLYESLEGLSCECGRVPSSKEPSDIPQLEL